MKESLERKIKEYESEYESKLLSATRINTKDVPARDYYEYQDYIERVNRFLARFEDLKGDHNQPVTLLANKYFTSDQSIFFLELNEKLIKMVPLPYDESIEFIITLSQIIALRKIEMKICIFLIDVSPNIYIK